MSLLIGFAVVSVNLVPASAQSEQKAHNRYRDLLLPVLVSGLIGPQEKVLVFTTRTKDAGIPAAGPKLEILSTGGPILLSSDSDGFLRFPFTLPLLKENPPIQKLNDSLVFELRLTSSMKRGIKRRIELSAGDKQFVENGRVRVWYPPKLEHEAKEILQQLTLVRRHIHSELGIEPATWGINLIDEELSEVNFTTLQDYPRWYTWSYSISEIASAKGQKSNAHEWVEYTLGECAGLTQSSHRGSNRFVFDGLAEYVSIRFSRYVPTDYCGRLQAMLGQGTAVVNLPRKFLWQARRHTTPEQLQNDLFSFSAGYPLSFAFWERLCAEHGRDLPKRFLALARQERRSDYDSCLRILGQLCGAGTPRSELEAMDVSEAVQLIEDVSRSLRP